MIGTPRHRALAAAFERVAIAVIERLPADDADARYAALLPEATHASLADRAGRLKLALAQHFVEFRGARVQQVAVALWRAPVKGGATTDEDTASAAAGALWRGSRHVGGAGAAGALLERVIAQHERLLTAERAGGHNTLTGGALLALASALNAPPRCLRTPRVRFLLDQASFLVFLLVWHLAIPTAPRAVRADDDDDAASAALPSPPPACVPLLRGH